MVAVERPRTTQNQEVTMQAYRQRITVSLCLLLAALAFAAGVVLLRPERAGAAETPLRQSVLGAVGGSSAQAIPTPRLPFPLPPQFVFGPLRVSSDQFVVVSY